MSMMSLRAILIILLLVQISSNFCPQKCSGHGRCNSVERECSCDFGYRVVADCSLRSCPRDVAFADKAQDSDRAHHTAECSRNGVCDRNSGQCVCYPGYVGQACQKLVCGNGPDTGTMGCSGHGTCLTIGQAYEQYTPSKNYRSPEYLNWDADHTTMCDCEMGYTGPSCSLQMCPKGFDPIQPVTGYYTLKIQTHAASGVFYGNMKLAFNSESFFFPSNVSAWSPAACESSFTSLYGVSRVSCSHIAPDYPGGGTTYTVIFDKFPSKPYENNHYTNNGNPPLTAFGCSSFNAHAGRRGQISCTLSIATPATTTVPHYSYCAGRGLCDLTSGTCKCFTGFSNSNCDTYATSPDLSLLVPPNDVLVLSTTNASFDNSILHLHASYPVVDDIFSWIRASDSITSKFVLDALGNVNIVSGSLHFGSGSGGVTVGNGGVRVRNSASVMGGGLSVTGGMSLSSNALTVIGGMSVTGGLTIAVDPLGIYTGMQIKGGLTVNSKGIFITNGGIQKVIGGATISTGGLGITGGLTVVAGGVYLNKKGMLSIHTGGLRVTGGITSKTGVIAAEGINVIDSGMSLLTGDLVEQSDGIFYDGSTTTFVAASGFTTDTLTVSSGGATITGGVSLQSQGVTARGGLKILNGGFLYSGALLVGGGIAVKDSGLTVSGGLSIFDTGMSVTGGMTILGGGVLASSTLMSLPAVLVATGGASIQSRGLTVTGGVTVNNVGLNVDLGGVTISGIGMVVNAGLTIADSGFTSTGGLTARTLGVYVSDGGVALHGTYGLSVVGGLTVMLPGFNVAAGGMTVAGGGMSVTGGLTVYHGNGMYVTQGVTVVAGGLYVTGGFSVRSLGTVVADTGVSVWDQGVTVTGGMTIKDSGLRVAGGLTIPNLALTGGITVESGGIMARAITVMNAGMSVSGGMTIILGGLKVTGGLSVTDGFIAAAGVSIETGGIVIMLGGLSVPSSGAVIHDGVKVYGLGAVITGGVTQRAYRTTGPNPTNPYYNGTHITGGLSVSTAGIYAIGGVTVNDAGLMGVTQGMTIAAGGLYASGLTMGDTYLTVSGGITVAGGGIMLTTGDLDVSTSVLIQSGGMLISGGASVTGGLSVVSGGLSVLNFITVLAGGVRVLTGGLTVSDGGVVVTGGYTVAQGGLIVTGGGVTVSAGPMSVTGGATFGFGGLNIAGGGLQAVGMTLTGGLTLSSGNMMVTAGVTISSGGLYVAGGGMTVYGGSFFSTPGPMTFSDRRLKTRIEQLEMPLSKVSKLRGVYFSWIVDEESGLTLDDRRHVGLIAQDVQAVLPEVVQEMGAVTQGKGSYLGVNYAEMVPLLLEAIRELDERTSSLRGASEWSSDIASIGKVKEDESEGAGEEEGVLLYRGLAAPLSTPSTCNREELLEAIEQLRAMLDGVERENELLEGALKEAIRS